MFQEDGLIPFQSSKLPHGDYLVFAPHPDDETFGMGGTLLLARDHNINIHIVFLTSGELGGEPNTREAEAKLVCKNLNASYEFLSYPDRNTKATFKRFNDIKQIIQRLNPSNIFLPSPLEYHIDHRTCAAIIWRATQLSNTKANVYCYEISCQSECNMLIDVSSKIDEKVNLCEKYQSQIIQNNYIDVCLALNKARTYTLGKGIEYAEAFMKVNHNRLPKFEFMNSIENAFLNILPYETPVISFLIRTFNRLDLLERCIESLISQNYSDFIEVIIVNDGGEKPDKIISNYQSQFRKIKLINCPDNRGRAASANTALKHANGDFINFLDDDDTLESNHVNTFLNKWRRDNSIKALYRGVNVINSDGDIIHTYNEPFNQARLMHANFIPIHSMTFSKEFIEMGLRFDETLPCYEDWDFWLQLSRLTEIKHSSVITSNYYMQGNSICSPHMQDIYDSENHTQRIREKWQSKWTALEHNLILNFFRNIDNLNFQDQLNSIKSKAIENE